jgi:DnaJ-class molecular chaperone
MDQFAILGVDRGADDTAIRKAYLQKIIEHSPDRDPEAFKRLSGAYEAVKDENSRIRTRLFSTDPGMSRPFDAIVEEFKVQQKREPPSITDFMRYLRQCQKTR